MGTIADKLNELKRTKDNIKAAIISKGVNVADNTPFSSYPNKIAEIETGGIAKPRVTAKYTYHRNSPETNLTQKEIDSYVIVADSMFSYCTKDKINVIDGKKIIIVGAEKMFYNCQFLTSLDVSSFDTSNVTTMSYMFYNCSRLTSIDVSNWDTSNVTTMSYMFYSCSKLKEFDLSMFNLNNCDNIMYMFGGCASLLKLRLPDIPKSSSSSIQMLNSACSKCNDFQFVNGGTFVNNSTSSSLTLSLVYIWKGAADAIATGHDKTNGFFYEAFANSIGENTSGKTRTIKLYTTLYNSLSDEQKALLTDKGYTISYGTS